MEYDKRIMKGLAKNIKQYIDNLDRYAMIEGLSEEEYKEAMKTTKKLIKKLKKGKGDEVFDKDEYREALNAGLFDDLLKDNKHE